MKQYNYVWGTDPRYLYTTMFSSKSLESFLQKKIGAPRPEAVVDMVKSLLSGFERLGDFNLNQLDQLPAAIRYCPMHLQKQPGMSPTMKSFGTLCISGDELRAERAGCEFNSMVFIPQEEFVKYNFSAYLDNLAGNHLPTHRSMKSLRGKTLRWNPDGERPYFYPDDWKYVKKAAEALFSSEVTDGQNVVIRLEQGCNFNHRSLEILSQIYALLPPLFAFEVGFASYQDPNLISKLTSKMSIRLITIPACCDLPTEGNGIGVVIDLAGEKTDEPEQETELGKALKFWRDMPSDERFAIYSKLFADTQLTFNREETFLDKTNSFRKEKAAFEEWVKSAPEGSIASVEDLKALCEKYPHYMCLERYVKHVKKNKIKIDFSETRASLIATAAVDNNRDSLEQYEFLTTFDASDINGRACRLAGNEIKSRTVKLKDKECEEKVSTLRSEYEHKISDLCEKNEESLREKANEIASLNDLVNQKEQEKRDEIGALIRQFDDEKNQLCGEYEQKFNNLVQEFQQRSEQYKKHISDRDAALTELGNRYAEKETEVVKLNACCAEKDEEITKLNECYSVQKTTLENLNSQYSEQGIKLSNLQMEYETAKTNLSALSSEKRELDLSLEKSIHEKEMLLQNCREYEDKLQRLNALVIELKQNQTLQGNEMSHTENAENVKPSNINNRTSQHANSTGLFGFFRRKR